MKVKIVRGGGYRGTFLDVESLPRLDEIIRLGRWEGVVCQVTHVPLPPDRNRDPEGYRKPDGPVAELVIDDVVQIRRAEGRRSSYRATRRPRLRRRLARPTPERLG
jgi:hypothetical protein